MPRIMSASVEEHNISISPYFSCSSPLPSGTPQWPVGQPEEPKTPEYPDSRRKRIRTAPLSPPESCLDKQESPVHCGQSQTSSGFQTPRTPSPTSSDRKASDGIAYLPTPPESLDGGAAGDLLDLTYEVQARPLSQCRLTSLASRGRVREPGLGARGAGTPQSASTASPDRYISSRNAQDSTRSFRLGKPPHLLSDAEKLLRNDSATPDPFVSGSPTRTRRERPLVSNSLSRSTSRSQSRSVSNPDALTIAQLPLPSLQLRQASVGAVWNIGGGSSHPTGPIRAISDGRGGLIGGGTNAPLYTAKFLSKEGSEEDEDTFQHRLAAALDIDRTRRTLDFSRPQPRGRKVSGTKRKRADFISRTQWKYGEWMREGDISCKPTRGSCLEFY